MSTESLAARGAMGTIENHVRTRRASRAGLLLLMGAAVGAPSAASGQTYAARESAGEATRAAAARIAARRISASEPLDDVSFLFYARTLPLRVGDVDTIPRYFKQGRDVILRVLRKERITVPAGPFETIVVQPTITNAGGLFGQGGQAEVYFSD